MKLKTTIIAVLALVTVQSTTQVNAASNFATSQIKAMYQEFNNSNATQNKLKKQIKQYRTVLIGSKIYDSQTENTGQINNYSNADKEQFTNQLDGTTDVKKIYEALGYNYTDAKNDYKQNAKKAADAIVSKTNDKSTQLNQLSIVVASDIKYTDYYDPDSQTLTEVAKFTYKLSSYVPSITFYSSLTINNKGHIMQ